MNIKTVSDMNVSAELDKVTIIDSIARRRAVFPRQFNDEAISKEEIGKLLEAANWAPSHKRTEPWRFKVILGDEKLKELSEFVGAQYKAHAKKFSERKYQGKKDKCLRSAAVILVCMQRDLKERVPEWEEVSATAMAVQNLWLTASSMKIGGYWSTPPYISNMGSFIELKEGESCLGLFYLGKYDGELPEGFRLDWKEKVEWL